MRHRKLSSYLRPYWKSVTLAPLLMLLEVGMDLLQPKLMASIVNDGVLKGDLDHIWRTGVMMVVYAFIGLVGGVGCTVFSSIAAAYFATDVRRDLFAKVQTFAFRNLDTFSTGSLVTRLTHDVVQVQNLVQMMLRILVRAPFLVIGSLAMAVIISPSLSLIMFIVVPILLVALVLLNRRAFPLFASVQNKLDRVNTVLQENLSGIRVVKAFVRAAFENRRFGAANGDYTDTALKAARVVALNMPIMTLLLNAGIVAVLWFGGVQARDHQIQIGDLIAFINYVTQMLFSLMTVAMFMMAASRAKASADRINEVLATEPDIADQEDARRDVIREGRLSFDSVSFAYAGKEQDPVLENISFEAYPGQTVAFLGATGAGKSSLVSLIPRLYEASAGTIRIDGADVRTIALDHLRSRIGTVLQQAILFSGTLRDNIRYGRPDASQEEVEAAAKAAQAHDFIMQMPEGYDTLVGQRGVNLSGGQKQRISIARAILIRPAILILDDSTSAVDLGTEARIQAALKQLMHSSTCLLIAQRISSVMEADQIMVLEDGRIAARGTHTELLESSEVYRDIYKSQLGKGEAIHG
ncbi:ABC transporter ATP-binding protein [Paenibacillus sp. y28]|uniref:ABC transporter ATP-binding protein n=1 Tax=Paenibacillus sp. y28 TaxID=3129110 RepID=UPI00301B2BAA